MSLFVIGDALLDRDLEGTVERLCPDAPAPVVDQTCILSRPGGAGLAASILADQGEDVTLVTAIGADDAGDELRQLLDQAGVTVADMGLSGQTPEKIRVVNAGRCLLRIDRGGGEAVAEPPDELIRQIRACRALLVSDYGRGVAAQSWLGEVIRAGMPTVWDPHPKGPLPLPGVWLATPNRRELLGGRDGDLATVADRARHLVRSQDLRAVAVTLGSEGALVVVDPDGAPLVIPAPVVPAADPCGAGDAFAAGATRLLAVGATLAEAVMGGVELATAFVGAGGAAGFAARSVAVDLRNMVLHRDTRLGATAAARAGPLVAAAGEDPFALAGLVRRTGGTVVATGGCFDLLHAGHVKVLQAARRLGDCLIVCLNSDSSVTRIKGVGRPLQPAEDRAAVLLGLGCVDAVVVFDEDTPVRALTELRPHIFAKGGDYLGTELPESVAIRDWGGQVVLLPYLEGRSTTRLVMEAARNVPAL